MKKDDTKYDCIIVGAGPAGLAAAIQAARQGLCVALFEAKKTGGQALYANLIENYPGFPEGITGAELIERFVKQAKLHGIEIKNEEVDMVKTSGSDFKVETNWGEYRTRTVIVACGLEPKRFGLVGEEKLIGKRIFPYYDLSGMAIGGKNIAVLGGGDAAFDLALGTSKAARDVKIFIRGKTPKCNPLLLKKVEAALIPLETKHQPVFFRGSNDRIVIGFKTPSGPKEEAFDYAISAIGKEDRTKFLHKTLRREKVPGLFMAGDCVRDRHRHISIAAGDGARAAMEAFDHCR